MTLPTSGAITDAMIINELRVANPGRGYPLGLLDADVLALAGKSAGPIKLPDDLYGKSAIPPFSLTGNSASNSANTQFSNGTVSCSPSVTRNGGTGTVSYSWVVLSNPNNATVTLGSGPSVIVSKSYLRNENGFAQVQLRCTATDQASQQRTVDVTGTLEWSGNL